MGEFGKEIAVKGVVAIVAVLFLASLAFYSPLGTNTTSLLTSSLVESGRTVTSITTSTYTQTHTNVVPGPLVTTTVTVSGTMTSNNTGDLAALLLGIVYSQNVTCSLSSGTCTMTMVNEGKTSGYDVVAVGCQQLIISSKNSTTTVWSIIQGEIGGRILGVPTGAKVVAMCSIPTSELSLQTAGSSGSGLITVELLNNLYSFPAGSIAYISFQGQWS